jgi:SAM-dependent methyltransferase
MTVNAPDASLLDDVARYYSSKVREHGATARGVDWNSEATQELRFSVLSTLLPAAGFHVVDLGCGYGGYADFLAAERRDFRYTGIDVSPDMIEHARAQHAGAPNLDFACDSAPPRADYVVASGIFNVRQSVGDEAWLDYVHGCIASMDAASTRGFAFNCLTSYSDAERKRDYLYYADPAEMFRHCMRYSRHVDLLHGYGLYEFTVLVRKGPSE